MRDHALQDREVEAGWLVESATLLERFVEITSGPRLTGAPQPPRKGQRARPTLRAAARHLAEVEKKSQAVRKQVDRLRADLTLSLNTYKSIGRVDYARFSITLKKFEALANAVREMFFPFTKAREGIKTVVASLHVPRKRLHSQLPRSESQPVTGDPVPRLFETMVGYAIALGGSVDQLVRRTQEVRKHLAAVAGEAQHTPEADKALNDFLDYRDQFGPLIYRYVGGMQKRLNEVARRFGSKRKYVTLEHIDQLLEALTLRLSRRLGKTDPIKRAERRIKDRVSPAPSDLARGRKRRLRQKRDFKNRTKDRLPKLR